MTEIKKVVYGDEEPIELTIPVYLSDDENQSASELSNPEEASLSAALFVFNIIQTQIEQLMELMGGDDK